MNALDRDDPLASALRQIAREDAALAAPPDLERRLAGEFNAVAARRRSASRRRSVGLVAAAAALLVAALLPAWRFLARHDRPAGVESIGPRLGPTAIRPSPSAVELTASQSHAPAPEKRLAARGHTRRRPAQRVREPEVVTEFIPLTYGDVPLAGGQLVRLRIARSALAVFLRVPAEHAETGLPAAVLADVVVGEDGLARAVRFVNAAETER